MPDFTRLTIIGTERKADLVIPNDEAIGGMLPRLMELLGERSGSVARPLTLVRPTGEQLDVSLTVAEQDIADGELLRFVRSDDAPPPPEVADVTDVLGESLADRPGLWSRESRQLTGALALGVLGAASASLLTLSWTAYALVLIVLAVAALVAGRLGARWACVAVTSVGLGIVVPLALRLAQQVGQGGLVVTGLAVAFAATAGWVLLGVGFGLGLGRGAARWGALFGVGLALLPLVLVPAGVRVPGIVALTAVAAVLCCGLLPRYAMTVSGLTGLDDQVVEGQLRRRDEVERTVHEAYQSLSWAVFAVALPIAAGIAWLLGDRSGWAVGIGVVVVLITALRTRSFPLAVQQLVLWLAALTGLAAGLLRQDRLTEPETVGLLAAVAVLAVVLVAVGPAAHQRAFWRRAGNLVESLSVISLVPLLLGLFGVYGDLLKAFHR